ncbi:MAG TPA: imidazolonepropionase [Bacteroidales bacterium]|nr:imidazolonepropionase [Bacteroidales bacterium]
MRILIKNISGLMQTLGKEVKMLSGKDMSVLSYLPDSYLLIEDGLIAGFGVMDSIPDEAGPGKIIDASGRFVFPSFCDSHTHIVYAGSREAEFADKIKGLSYAEIARRGGGILNSAKLLHNTPDEDIYHQAMGRINEIISKGTGAIEIKSGYGLNTEDELRMLRIIRKIRENTPAEVKATFLGAHALPQEFRDDRDGYIELVINEMIPAVASEELADFIDVFCDTGFFTVEETERILMAGIKYGLRARIHANELGFSGGVQAGVRYDALSVDHLECSGEDEINALLGSSTIPTILPGSAFFLGLPEAPVRKMIDAGLPVAMASDYNPGSSPSGDMKFIMSLGCIRHRMTPEEALNAVTINSAAAMGISETHGSITRGKVANLFITKKIPSYEFMPYAFGSDLIDTVILKGRIIEI